MRATLSTHTLQMAPGPGVGSGKGGGGVSKLSNPKALPIATDAGVGWLLPTWEGFNAILPSSATRCLRTWIADTPFTGLTLGHNTATSGDGIGFDGLHFGVAVPEPSTCLLLALGLALTVSRGGKRMKIADDSSSGSPSSGKPGIPGSNE